MAFESGELSGAPHNVQAGAEQSQQPVGAVDELEWTSDAEEVSTTLAEPDKALTEPGAGGPPGAIPGHDRHTWVCHPVFGWGRIQDLNKKTGGQVHGDLRQPQQERQGDVEAYDLADTITHFLGKGGATRRCTLHDSKLYLQVHRQVWRARPLDGLLLHCDSPRRH